MKKILFSILAVGLFGGLGSGFAQTTATHDLTINIPALMGVRILDNDGAISTTAAVNFNFDDNGANEAAYVAAITAGPAIFSPTSVSDFANVQVMNNIGTWSLKVKASMLSFSGTGNGVSLADITVAPSAASAPVTSVATRALATTEADVARGDRTPGWINVGITGNSYTLSVNGDEDPGTYSTTVTYTLYSL